MKVLDSYDLHLFFPELDSNDTSFEGYVCITFTTLKVRSSQRITKIDVIQIIIKL